MHGAHKRAAASLPGIAGERIQASGKVMNTQHTK